MDTCKFKESQYSSKFEVKHCAVDVELSEYFQTPKTAVHTAPDAQRICEVETKAAVPFTLLEALCACHMAPSAFSKKDGCTTELL